MPRARAASAGAAPAPRAKRVRTARRGPPVALEATPAGAGEGEAKPLAAKRERGGLGRQVEAWEFEAATAFLAERHASAVCWVGGCGEKYAAEDRAAVLNSLVRTILSQNTTDITSQRAFNNMRAEFGAAKDGSASVDYVAVRDCAVERLAASVRVGGLADIKAGRIQVILRTLTEEQHGSCEVGASAPTLEHLRLLPDEEIKQYLSRFKGVGPKTVACVLMFALGRHEFPVDTHVWQLAQSLGWVSGKAGREQTYDHLNAIVPGHLKLDLHVLLVEHGKRDGHAATLLKKAIAAAKPGGECKPGCKPESKPVVNVKMEAVI